MGKVVCPRCGEEGYLVNRRVGNREYLYVDHQKPIGTEEITDASGKKMRRTKYKRWSCYLGPAEGYKVASKFQPFELKGLMAKGREMEYFIALVDDLKIAGKLDELKRMREVIDRAIEWLTERANKAAEGG